MKKCAGFSLSRKCAMFASRVNILLQTNRHLAKQLEPPLCRPLVYTLSCTHSPRPINSRCRTLWVVSSSRVSFQILLGSTFTKRRAIVSGNADLGTEDRSWRVVSLLIIFRSTSANRLAVIGDDAKLRACSSLRVMGLLVIIRRACA